MNEYLRPNLDEELQNISVLGLAHVGDAVFELMVRTWLCTHGAMTAKRLHDGAIAFVSAKAQAAASELIIAQLDNEELAVFKRGRNAHVNSVPQGSTYVEYHMATGIETLFGFLYLKGRTDRLNELFETIVEQ